MDSSHRHFGFKVSARRRSPPEASIWSGRIGRRGARIRNRQRIGNRRRPLTILQAVTTFEARPDLARFGKLSPRHVGSLACGQLGMSMRAQTRRYGRFSTWQRRGCDLLRTSCFAAPFA